MDKGDMMQYISAIFIDADVDVKTLYEDIRQAILIQNENTYKAGITIPRAEQLPAHPKNNHVHPLPMQGNLEDYLKRIGTDAPTLELNLHEGTEGVLPHLASKVPFTPKFTLSVIARGSKGGDIENGKYSEEIGNHLNNEPYIANLCRTYGNTQQMKVA